MTTGEPSKIELSQENNPSIVNEKMENETLNGGLNQVIETALLNNSGVKRKKNINLYFQKLENFKSYDGV